MIPRIEQLIEKKVIGIKLIMSLAENTTPELWKQFMPRRKEITNNVSNELISLQVYSPLYFSDFKPTNIFEKRAVVEVSDFNLIPKDMDAFIIPNGLYAVFEYQGSSSDSQIFQYIFNTWLPNSDFDLDNRPHFEVLGEKYKNDSIDSEEEIWIPIKKKITL